MIEAKRTFWEKVTILYREAHRRTNTIPPRYSRHYYDVYLLAKSVVKEEAICDKELLNDVIQFKIKFYRSSWAKYEDIWSEGVKLLPRSDNMKILREDYRLMQGMIFGIKLSLAELLTELKVLEKEINNKVIANKK